MLVNLGARLHRLDHRLGCIWTQLQAGYPFDRDAILFSAGNDWLAYESFAIRYTAQWAVVEQRLSSARHG